MKADKLDFFVVVVFLSSLGPQCIGIVLPMFRVGLLFSATLLWKSPTGTSKGVSPK